MPAENPLLGAENLKRKSLKKNLGALNFVNFIYEKETLD